MLHVFSLAGSMQSSSKRACLGARQAHAGVCSPAATCVGVQQHLAHAGVQIDVLGMLRS